MIVVLADDFSGAVGVAGVGHRYGLSLEIQQVMNLDPSLDMIVVNTNTRTMSEQRAVETIENLCLEMIRSDVPVKLFKKIDAAMRGHIVPELGVLQYHFEFDKMLMFPTNPSQGGTLKSGRYLLDGVPLNETVFAHDPVYPAKYAHLEDIISAADAIFDHTHIQGDLDIMEGLITTDVATTADIKDSMSLLNEMDLCCGASDCFVAFLENQGFQVKDIQSPKLPHHEKVLLVNGSAIKREVEGQRLVVAGFHEIGLPSGRHGNLFYIERLDFEEWTRHLKSSILAKKLVRVTVEHPISHERKLSNLFLDWFSNVGTFTKDNLVSNDLLLALTGGSTASAFLKGFGVSTLCVKQELAMGVVIVCDRDNLDQTFVIKPGNYQWPVDLFN